MDDTTPEMRDLAPSGSFLIPNCLQGLRSKTSLNYGSVTSRIFSELLDTFTVQLMSLMTEKENWKKLEDTKHFHVFVE